MYKLESADPLLIKERERAMKYLKDEILCDSIYVDQIAEDLINLSEARLHKVEINQQNIDIAYTKLYSPELKNILPPHVLKGYKMPEDNNLKIVN